MNFWPEPEPDEPEDESRPSGMRTTKKKTRPVLSAAKQRALERARADGEYAREHPGHVWREGWK